MTFTPDLDTRPREWLIDRVIELETLIYGKAPPMDGLPFYLSEMQRRILGALYAARGRRCSFEYLAEACGTESHNSLKSTVCHLRHRLKQQNPPLTVETQWGQGYWLGPDTLARLDYLLVSRPSEIISDRHRSNGALDTHRSNPVKGQANG